MNFITEFRDDIKIKTVAREIENLAKNLPFLNIMEICGGHTHTIMKYGLNQILPRNIEFIHGPGCPVCVTPQERVDQAIALANMDNAILATFGDMMRVPGSKSSLIKERARGRSIKMIFSPLDVLEVAKKHPDKKIIYFAIGFETTTPMTAVLLERVIKENIKNVFFHINHVLIPPAIEAIMDSKAVCIDAFVGPGHVSTITGSLIYEPIVEKYRTPIVISGFEPLDILQSVAMILKQYKEKRKAVEIQYKRVVRPEGNRRAQELSNRYFEIRESFRWRGLGEIPRSALKLKDEFSKFDVELEFRDILPQEIISDSLICICGEVLRGKAKPFDCKAFGNSCTPENPLGACMVSSEGACQAYYNYGYEG